VEVFGLRSFWIPLLAVTAVSMVLSLSIADRREDLRQMRKRKMALLHRLRDLRQHNKKLRSERQALMTSAAEIETVARRDYGFRGPGEVVMDVDSSTSTHQETNFSPVPDSKWERWLGDGEFPWRLPGLIFAFTAMIFTGVNLMCSGDEDDKDEPEEPKQPEDDDI